MSNNLSSIQTDFNQFILGFKTLTLATVTVDGFPEVSYAPFIRLDGVWYIYVSELATHTQNILNSGTASVLLVEPEGDAANLFARKRASFQMKAQEVSRGTECWSSVMTDFEVQFGHIMALLKGLSDFHLMALTPISGSFVRGFAQAFTLGGETMLLVQQRREHNSQDTTLVGTPCA